jgi:Fe-S cluster assembly scaffold protein SufB
MAARFRHTTTRNISHPRKYVTKKHSINVTVQKCNVIILLTGYKVSAKYSLSNSACHKTQQKHPLMQHHGLQAHTRQVSRIDDALIHG